MCTLKTCVGRTVWLTGRSGSGKTTIAKAYLELKPDTILIDGDELRDSITKSLGFSPEDRMLNNTIAARIAKEYNDAGKDVIVAMMTPTNEIRKAVVKILGLSNIDIIYLSTPEEVCKERDPKGLYSKGIIKEDVFESPYIYTKCYDTSDILNSPDLVATMLTEVFKRKDTRYRMLWLDFSK